MSITIEHGGAVLPSVTVDAYNAELREGEGFTGDRASKRAFQSLLDDVRDRLAASGDDPLGAQATDELDKETVDRLLAEGTAAQAGVIHTAVEEFAGEFASVIRRFLRLKAWRDTQRIVVGGGMRGTRVGELAIGRTEVLLRSSGTPVELVPIRSDPDQAGLLGGAHLAPSWIFKGHDSILAMDIGGTNVRVGLVALHLDRAKDLSRCEVVGNELWPHREERPKRDEAVGRIIAMLETLLEQATKQKLSLAPFIAVGCPGLIAPDGTIERGGQNLPGNWEARGFNLPERLRGAIPRIGEHETHVAMHNDAVVQGLSEAPFMRDVERWGVMTIGTGLGNARFTNRRDA
ncbi:MAG: ROK family protein [Acetobacteraceae bacterium]|nr:ROK family protein [Acetobacteraceae bacterium]